MSDFSIAFRAQAQTVGALIVRQLRSRHGSDLMATLWLLFEPALMLSIIIGIHLFRRTSSDQTAGLMVLVLMTGYIPHMLYRRLSSSGRAGIQVGRRLLFHGRINHLDLLLAAVIIDFSITMLATISIFFVVHYMGLLGAPRSMGHVYLGAFLHIWFIFTITCIMTAGGQVSRLVRRLSQPMSLLMMAPYAAFFMLNWMTPDIRTLLLYFPSANAAEIMRYGFLEQSYPTYFDISYTVGTCIVLTFLGLLLVRSARPWFNQ